MAEPYISFERDQWSGKLKASPISGGFTLTAGATLTTTDEAYFTVPWLYRAVSYFSTTVSGIPIYAEDMRTDEIIDEKDPRVSGFFKSKNKIMGLAGLSAKLYGAAYFLLESNRFGLNTTPRYIPRHYVTPIVDYMDGVTGFTVSFQKTGSRSVPLDRMVYVWEPNPASEVTPGPAPAFVALQAAGMLGALDRMTTRYFAAGAVPITAVKVSPATSPDDRAKLEGWFGRFAAGFRNAFKFLAVSQGTEFETIGANVKDTAAPELTLTQRDNVAVAIGVPPSIIEGRSTDESNSRSERVAFYTDQVVPFAELVLQSFNETYYNKAGVKLEVDKDSIEVLQESNLRQAERAQKLAGNKAILSVNEARDIVDYDPVPGGDWEQPSATPPPQFGQPTAAGSAAQALDDEEQMKRWLDVSLGLWRAGSPATAGTPWDAELAGASSANMVKRIYAAHWPRKDEPAETWQEKALVELARFNKLAEGALSNG